jgi:DNA (cytosine-5)-methyltransferase 1
MAYLRTETEEEIINKSKELSHISLFSGCGGFDLGFSMAGIPSRVMVEWDKGCCETLRANWHWEELKKRQNYRFEKGKAIETGPLWKTKASMKKSIKHYHEPEPVILQEDITKLSTQRILEAGNLKIGETTVITGGPPCQGFSTSGKRMIDDPRNSLFKEFVRVVREALPKLFVFENVPGLVSMAKGEIIKQICEEFANCGYNVAWKLLNAADYGVPQNRVRVIMIGKRIDVMRITSDERLELHLGAVPGSIDYPENFRKKHNMVLKGQTTMNKFKEPETFQELFQQVLSK